jgi:glycosyltransferase involved in cell wall biosynthesis
MKIACISTSQIPSTTANSIQVMKVCQQMQLMGHQVHCWLPGNQSIEFSSLSAQYGLHQTFEISWIPTWNQFKRYDFAWKAVQAAIGWQADVVYTWTPQAALLSSWRQKKTILEMHDRATGKLGLKILDRFVRSLESKNELVCVTQALKSALEDQLGRPIPAEQTIIAPNGVDTERYIGLPDRKIARAQLNLAEQYTVSYTGHFYAGRGLDVLYSMAQAYPAIQFLWIGGREQELSDVRAKLTLLKLENVRLTGFVDNQTLPLYQASSDVLLMPYEKSIAGSSGGNSADICSPMKMFEYMATGNPILTSDLPVIREVLDAGYAFFCPPEQPDAWIETLGWIMEHPQEADLCGNQAKKKLEMYSLKNRQEQILAHFEQRP